jgi:exosortase
MPSVFSPARLFAVALAIPWLILASKLTPEWELNPHYSFGWLMPFLTLFLFWKRWSDRPPPSQSLPTRSFSIGLALLLIPWTLLLVIHEANPDWRLTLWALATFVILSSILGLLHLGGTSWLSHFAFPIAFFLLAIPWPSGFESNLILTLMRWIATACVEALNWMGHAAIQQGNLIKLPEGTIGVDQACSGIRSLQANLMAALFVGELYRRSVPARFMLVAAGLALSLSLNLARALTLALLWIHHGDPAMDQWHDPAGHFILIISFALLLLIGRKRATSAHDDAPLLHIKSNTAPVRISLLVICGLVVSILATELWFTLRTPSRSREAPTWDLPLPAGPNTRVIPINPAITQMLRFDSGSNVLWDRNDHTLWSLFQFQWLPGKNSARLARAHSPETCLPAAGAELVPLPPLVVQLPSNEQLPFQQFEARIGKKTLHVFYLRWQENTPDEPSPTASVLNRRERLRMAWRGQREQEQRVIQIITEGYPDPEKAAQAVQDWLRQSLQTAPYPGETSPTRPQAIFRSPT